MRFAGLIEHLAPLVVASLAFACDARAAGAAPRRIAFNGRFSLSKETPTMDPSCAADGLVGDSGGIVILDSGANPTIRIDGLGCSISVATQGNDAWLGTPGACVPDGVTGARAIGISQVVVDECTLDVPGSTFHLRTHLQRYTASGPVWLCMDIQATTSTTLPTAASRS